MLWSNTAAAEEVMGHPSLFSKTCARSFSIYSTGCFRGTSLGLWEVNISEHSIAAVCLSGLPMGEEKVRLSEPWAFLEGHLREVLCIVTAVCYTFISS